MGAYASLCAQASLEEKWTDERRWVAGCGGAGEAGMVGIWRARSTLVCVIFAEDEVGYYGGRRLDMEGERVFEVRRAISSIPFIPSSTHVSLHLACLPHGPSF